MGGGLSSITWLPDRVDEDTVKSLARDLNGTFDEDAFAMLADKMATVSRDDLVRWTEPLIGEELHFHERLDCSTRIDFLKKYKPIVVNKNYDGGAELVGAMLAHRQAAKMLKRHKLVPSAVRSFLETKGFNADTGLRRPVLLDGGTRPMTPFGEACFVGNLAVAQWLFTHGAAADASLGNNLGVGATPTYAAALKGHLAVCTWLHDGAGCVDDVATPTTRGLTPLHAAALGNHVALIHWFVAVTREAGGADRPLYASTSSAPSASLSLLLPSPAADEPAVGTSVHAAEALHHHHPQAHLLAQAGQPSGGKRPPAAATLVARAAHAAHVAAATARLAATFAEGAATAAEATAVATAAAQAKPPPAPEVGAVTAGGTPTEPAATSQATTTMTAPTIAAAAAAAAAATTTTTMATVTGPSKAAQAAALRTTATEAKRFAEECEQRARNQDTAARVAWRRSVVSLVRLVKARDGEGASPLALAARCGHAQAALALVQLGALHEGPRDAFEANPAPSPAVAAALAARAASAAKEAAERAAAESARTPRTSRRTARSSARSSARAIGLRQETPEAPQEGAAAASASGGAVTVVLHTAEGASVPPVTSGAAAAGAAAAGAAAAGAAAARQPVAAVLKGLGALPGTATAYQPEGLVEGWSSSAASGWGHVDMALVRRDLFPPGPPPLSPAWAKGCAAVRAALLGSARATLSEAAAARSLVWAASCLAKRGVGRGFLFRSRAELEQEADAAAVAALGAGGGSSGRRGSGSFAGSGGGGGVSGGALSSRRKLDLAGKPKKVNPFLRLAKKDVVVVVTPCVGLLGAPADRLACFGPMFEFAGIVRGRALRDARELVAVLGRLEGGAGAGPGSKQGGGLGGVGEFMGADGEGDGGSGDEDEDESGHDDDNDDEVKEDGGGGDEGKDGGGGSADGEDGDKDKARGEGKAAEDDEEEEEDDW